MAEKPYGGSFPIPSGKPTVFSSARQKKYDPSENSDIPECRNVALSIEGDAVHPRQVSGTFPIGFAPIGAKWNKNPFLMRCLVNEVPSHLMFFRFEKKF